MFLKIYLLLKGYKKIPFTYIERHNSIHYPFRYAITVYESDRELYYSFEDDDNIPYILSKIHKEKYVTALCIHDYKTQQHYWKELYK